MRKRPLDWLLGFRPFIHANIHSFSTSCRLHFMLPAFLSESKAQNHLIADVYPWAWRRRKHFCLLAGSPPRPQGGQVETDDVCVAVWTNA